PVAHFFAHSPEPDQWGGIVHAAPRPRSGMDEGSLPAHPQGWCPRYRWCNGGTTIYAGSLGANVTSGRRVPRSCVVGGKGATSNPVAATLVAAQHGCREIRTGKEPISAMRGPASPRLAVG